MEAVPPLGFPPFDFPHTLPRWGRGERCSLGQMQMEKASDSQ